MKIKTAALVFLILSIFYSCKKDSSSTTVPPVETGGTYSQSSGTNTREGRTYSSSTNDLSAVKVTGGTFNISGSKISSTGNSSSPDSSRVYGLNAVMLANNSAIINSSGNTISSTGTGASGIYAYSSASITSTGDKITHTGNESHAIISSDNGSIVVKNDTAVTSGINSSTISVDSIGGPITIIGGTYTANGSNSAAIYSKGTITCTNATLTSNNAEALVIDGSHKITLGTCTVKSTSDNFGALVYQSASTDASAVSGYLIMTNGSYTYTGTKGSMFYNTNATAYFTLDSVSLSNSCDTLVKCIKGTWEGFSASDGGITYLTVKKVAMTGLIHVDANSIAHITLLKSSAYTGAINNSNTAKLATLTMDSSSSWTVTADSYINGLITNPGISGTSVNNITGNGNNVYYAESANTSLGGLTYSLKNGGQLIPQ